MKYRITERQVVEHTWIVDSDDVPPEDLEAELDAMGGVPDDATERLIESRTEAVALNDDGTPNICPDCDADIGQMHDEQCDVARCLVTGGQRLSCMGWGEPHAGGGHGNDVWSGRWPGEAEAEEFGWYAVLEPHVGWKSVPPGTPGAMLDLNRLHREAKWDPDRRRFVLP